MMFKDMFDGAYTDLEGRQFYVNNGNISATISWPDKYAEMFEAASDIEDEDEREKEYFRIEGLAEEDDDVWNLLREASGCVENKSGAWISFEQAVELMNDDLREEIHDKMAPCSDQEFFTAYEEAHEEKFGEMWELSKENPVY